MLDYIINKRKKKKQRRKGIFYLNLHEGTTFKEFGNS